MENTAVAVTAIAMTGLFLSVVAWKLLDIAREAVSRDGRYGAARQQHEPEGASRRSQ